MALALWSVYNTTSFDEAVTRSVNLLGDADSHGSICGQIAGAFYGYRSINPQFIRWLSQWDEHEFAARAVLLHGLGLHGPLALAARAEEGREERGRGGGGPEAAGRAHRAGGDPRQEEAEGAQA